MQSLLSIGRTDRKHQRTYPELRLEYDICVLTILIVSPTEAA